MEWNSSSLSIVPARSKILQPFPTYDLSPNLTNYARPLPNQSFSGGEVYRPGVYLLLPEDRTVRHLNDLSNWGVDVVFVHGLLGGVFYTWRQLDEDNSRGWGDRSDLSSTEEYSYCWPRDWLRGMSPHVRVIGVDFDTHLSQWGREVPQGKGMRESLEERSNEILDKLQVWRVTVCRLETAIIF